MDDRRRLSFGQAAELYDRRRPSYPASLVDDVIALAGGTPLTALEVGAGTGKATILFADRGVGVDAVEPSPGMAAMLRVNAAERQNVTIIEQEFESLEPPERPYRLLFSAQAWHWIDPARRLALARAALRPGGLLAPFWNRLQWEENALKPELDEVYSRLAPQILENAPMDPRSMGAQVWANWLEELEAAPGFSGADTRTYEWVTSYTADEYTEMLRTHSDHAVLDPEIRDALLRGVADVIDAAGGELHAGYITRLCLARAV